MKKLFLICFIAIVGCKDNSSRPEDAVNIDTQEKPLKSLNVLDYNGLEPLLHKDDDKLHVVNFWATWCAPCVKELPYFEGLHDTYKTENIDVLLVSLDFPSKYESNLLPFIEKHKLRSEVIALDDTDQNRWIPAIDSTWSGAIPATIIYKGNKRKFYEQSFTEEELKIEIEQFLN